MRVSADSRYVLYVNGRRVAAGPSRGDLRHWRYARVDVGPDLRPGENVVAAKVWSDGRLAPMAQISTRTAFLLQAEEPVGAMLNTGPQWRVRVDASRGLASGQDQLEREVGPTYYVAGSPETHDASRAAADFADGTTKAVDWVAAKAAVEPWEPSPWRLTPDPLPQMLYRAAPAGRVVRAQGAASTRFPEGPLQVPAHSSATLLVDAGAVQAAYPRLTVSGGAGATVSLTYAESLYDAAGKRLADRASIEGGVVRGLTDTFMPAGAEGERFEPFWWRTWRYVEIRVRTGAAPVRLDGFERRLTGYPFETVGRFRSSDPELDKIWRIGWDTVKLDAHETFMDTAYWEQLQYVGDSRLMALVAYAASRDPRLPAQAIEAIAQSSVDDLPLSRYPANRDQSIPPFALLWIGMLHDHWMREPDTAVTRRSLPTMRRVLDWFEAYRRADGLVAGAPGWMFIDWRPGLGEFPGPENRVDNRCLISLLYVGALQQAAQLESALGETARGQEDAARARQVGGAITARCWSGERGLFADGPDKRAFSQHANALAVLYDVAPQAEQRAIIDRITVRDHGLDAPSGITPTTFYFGFYLVRALEHAGLSDRYFEILK
ncbi:MAG: family 78 glycoside hydrolase catalytic domain, partial [Asticcacaulis sp.]|nr:family 78 glycoside hydrolase catalytic domain [Asticcacaulis sp.]